MILIFLCLAYFTQMSLVSDLQTTVHLGKENVFSVSPLNVS